MCCLCQIVGELSVIQKDIPPQQGLKLIGLWEPKNPLLDSEGHSTTTRIETPLRSLTIAEE